MISLARPLLGKLLLGAAVMALCAGLWFRGETYRKAMLSERAAHALTIERVRTAQLQAEARARAALAAQEAAYRTLARKADDDSQTRLVDAQRRAVAFAAANRVVCPQSARGAPSGPSPAASGGSARSGDRASVPAELVAVPERDVLICTTNTTRLEAVRQWALSLGHP